MSEPLPTFDPRRMRFACKTRKPYPGTRVLITGTIHNGNYGNVVENTEPNWKNRTAVKMGGVVFGFHTHNLIEILAD